MKIKKYYEDPKHAQEFVSNYDKISTNDIGPCKWIENNVVRPKVEEFLAVVIDNKTYTLGAPITLS
jgi:hypothetical protein